MVEIGPIRPSRTASTEEHTVSGHVGANNTELGIPNMLREIAPWPEQVCGEILLNDLTALFRRHLALTSGAAEILALWVLFTHAFDAFRVSPKLALLSPLPECGKTTALSLLSRLVPRALTTSNVSPAVVYRIIEDQRPTLLMDEADTYLEGKDELRGILNSGHTLETAFVLRCVGQDHEPKAFSTWTPMAIAKIGVLPPTLASRSLIILMHRRRADEHIEKLDGLRNGPILDELAGKTARWARDNIGTLCCLRPEMPTDLNNRTADNWRPLLAIAVAIGGDWPETARFVAVMFCGGVAEATLPEQLLADIRDIFLQSQLDRIASNQLCTKLGLLEGRPWANIENGSIMGPTRLASILRPFGIGPHSVRIGPSTPKGYELEDFEDAFARYVPQRRNAATTAVKQAIETSEPTKLPVVAAAVSPGG